MKKALLLFFALVTLSASAQISCLDSLKTYIDYEKVKPMVLVNGKPYKKPLNQLDSTKITHLYILLDEAATTRFKKAGKNGAIMVSMFKDKNSDTLTYAAHDTPPKFKGGRASSFSSWVEQQMKYPVFAEDARIETTVRLVFTVGPSGLLSHVRIFDSDNPAFNNEVMRVVGLSPIWQPASYKGEPKPYAVSMPINFRL